MGAGYNPSETELSAIIFRKTLTANSIIKLRRCEWLWPALLAGVAALRIDPLTTIALLLLLCYLPGRLLSAGIGPAASWDGAGRFVLAVATSLAVAPVLLNPIWHLTNNGWVLLAYVWLLLTAGALLRARLAARTRVDDSKSDNRRLRLFESTTARVIAVLVVALVAFGTIGPYWPTELRGYPVPSLIHDFIKHHGILFSLEQRPLPLGNPFFADNAAGPVYYYHFFYLIPATLRVLAPSVSIELAFGLQSAVVGIATAGMFYVLVKHFVGGDGPATLAALLATVLGGLDVIPLAILRMPVIILDAWADHPVRVHPFFTQMVWSPQNVQGVLIVLLAVYIFRIRGWWRGWIILGPLLAAGLIGASVWVSAGMFPGLLLFVLLEVVRLRHDLMLGLRRLLWSGVVAVLMVAAALPSLLGYLEMSQRHTRGLTTQWPHQSHALLGKLAPAGVLANLLDLPWVLMLELGPLLLFPLLAPRRAWRRAWEDPGLRLLLVSAVVALAGYVSVRSDFKYNDFGQKIIMVAMAAGVVLGACVLSPVARPASLLNPLGWSLHGQSSQRPRRILGGFIGLVLLLAIPQGLYQAPLTSIRRYVSEDGPLRVLAHPLAVQAAQEAALGRFLRNELSTDTVVQAHWGAERLELAQIARRQIGVTVLERDTMVFYPPDAGAHERALEAVSGVLAHPVAAQRCHETLRAHGITHVVVGGVEHARWQGLERFADARYFERVFCEGETAVYALR